VVGNQAGVQVSAGPVPVDIYFDYLCPECRIAEKSFAPVIAKLEAAHRVNLVYHPLGFLDSYSSPAGYSSRAAAAGACAADQGQLGAYTTVLFSRQPPERGPGLSTGQLIAAGHDAGITSPSFSACVRSGKYAAWVTYASDVAYSKDIAVTPTVFVNGQRVDVTGADPGLVIAQAVAAAKP
jgi:protein-disulfide isomerase